MKVLFIFFFLFILSSCDKPEEEEQRAAAFEAELQDWYVSEGEITLSE
jgi:hypothetical protein